MKELLYAILTDMALSVFDDRAAPPDDEQLGSALGRTSRLWSRLINELQEQYGPFTLRCHFSGPAFGWSLRLVQPKRVFIYLTPRTGQFLASLALGERAVSAARNGDAPGDVLSLLDAAPRYAEGRGVRVTVKTVDALRKVRALAALKAMK